MANNFTDQVYKKAREVFGNQEFQGDWQDFVKNTVRPAELLAATGPAVGFADALEKLRIQLRAGAPTKGGASGGSAPAGPTTPAQLILGASKPGKPDASWNERAAALKMLKHFYRYEKSGAQDVWIYSPPKAYAKWIFDELKGNEAAVLADLGKEEEVYEDGDKKTMCDALQFALMCSQKTEVLLSDAKPATIGVVQRWFGSSDAEAAADMATLNTGFKAITAICNSNTLVFPDDPNDRKSASQYDKLYGSVWPGGEGSFHVIYLAGAFKKAGTSGKRWLCAETIIHEASHLAVRTKDNRYDTEGLKPGASISHADAMKNADTWGYFCIDLCGFLSEADRNRILK